MHLSTDDAPNLWACARTHEAMPTLARLLRDAAPPDDRNDFGETALHVAAACGNDEAVQLLLRYGAELLAADWESGWTPLHRSLYHQHLSTSLLLLRHAQTRFGKKFVRKYLHETRDYAQQSPMQLLSTRLQHPQVPQEELESSPNAYEGGLVYTFGKRDYQLGYHLPNADMQVSPRLVELPVGAPIVQLSASKYHTIALNAAGECFVWGFGKGGRLGTGNEFDRIEPTRLSSLATTPMKKVAAGENHTMALSRTGQVFSWGSNSFGQLGHPGKSSSSQSRLTPKRIDAFRFHEVVDIAASGCHSAAIDATDGAVYTWGSNRRGQLGRKEGCGTDQADATPRTVDALRLRHPLCVVYGDYDSVRAEKLALSDWHTCVVLRCSHNNRSLGQVWQFGYGSYRPSRVNFPSDMSTGKTGVLMCDTWVPMCKQRGMDIVDVSCAQNHSIALTASGSVFTWGHNVPALSHHPSDCSHVAAENSGSSSPSPSAPQEVSLHTYGPVASVCASQDHCAVVTERGDLVTWGCGQQGVLGHGRGNTWQPSPKRVAGIKKAVAVAAGHQHTAVLVAPVHPDFNSVDGVAAPGTVPSLAELVERKIAAHVDVANCVLVWQYAERYAAFRLQDYCLGYMRHNWDAVLDVVGLDRMETLFDLMLPPLDEPEPEEKAPVVAGIDLLAKPFRDKKAFKTLPAAKSASGNASTLLTQKEEECVAGGNELVAASQQNRINSSKPSGRRKSSKFVPLTSFLSNKAAAVPARAASRSPWGARAISTSAEEEKPLVAPSKPLPQTSPVLSASPLATRAFPDAFPLPAASLRKESLDDAAPRQRKSSIGSHPSASPRLSFSPLPITGKHMLGYDGVEHEQVTAFSLDAFLKQPARRGSRGKSTAPAAPTWSDNSVAASKHKSPLKTLKQIQEEEEAAATREREAKARLGGGAAPAQRSTVNSWGLFRRPDHVSLADVQRLQEEQDFLEQQRQILAEIEREQAAKAEAMAAVPTVGGDRNKRPNKAKGKSAPAGNQRGQKAATSGGASTAASAAGSGGGGVGAAAAAAGDSQSKQQKQKKAKERKAARKAAGETFNAGSAVASIATQPGRGKKRGGRSPKLAAEASGTKGEGEGEAAHATQSRPRRKGKKEGAANAAAGVAA